MENAIAYKLVMNISFDDTNPDFLITAYEEIKTFAASYSGKIQSSGQIIHILDPCRCGERKSNNVAKDSKVLQ